MFGENYPVKYLTEREGEMKTTLCDISNAQDKLDYNPTRNLKEYIVEWVKKNE